MLIPSLAWRDSRGMRRRLVLYVSAMALGVAALVAIRSFGINLERAVAAQATEVFGSDLEVRFSGGISEANAALLDSLAGANRADVLRETSFASMALFPASGTTRFVQIRALDGPFPLYGRLVTTPADAGARFLADGEALADASLLLQMNAAVGDSVRVGNRAYRIAGQVDQVSGQPDLAQLVGPRVYLPFDAIDPALLSFGSRVRHSVAFRFADPEAGIAAVAPSLRAAGLRFETADGAQGDWTAATNNLARFLSLVGFVALLLGGIGVASSISVYVQEKAENVATLRCLGFSSRQVLGVYALQATALGLAGALVGVVLGLGVQRLLPLVFAAFLPVDVDNALVPRALAEGLGIGTATALLFAMLPLVGVRRVPPLRALRADAAARGFDPLRALLTLVLVAGVGGFAYLQTGTVQAAGWFVAGTLAVFALLTITARAVRAAVRALLRPGWPYAWRQGLANLYSPGNQTLVLLLTMGLGVFLVLSLALVQRALLAQVEGPQLTGIGGADLVLFDVQTDQRAGLDSLLRAEGLPVLAETPIVQMRLAEIDGTPVSALLADTAAAGPPRWALSREYRSSYRGATAPTETVTAGTFQGTAPPDADVVPVSLDQDLARDLGVGLGSRLVWDVAGVPVESEVTSLRRIDWAQASPNFFAVFPEGPLDDAPQTSIMLTRAGSAEASARVQRAVVEAYPNVSAVDVALVAGTIRRVLDRVAFVLRFMALFSVGTGLVVLAGAVRVALGQRTREAVLLRTLGASRAQVRRILLAEYALLGLLAALTGGVLALGGAWALARFAFDVPVVVDARWLVGTFALVPVLTALVGFAGSRAALRRPPLDVLRAEG